MLRLFLPMSLVVLVFVVVVVVVVMVVVAVVSSVASEAGRVVVMNCGEVCQMLSRRTKNSSYFINIQDTDTKVVPLHSAHQAPSYEPILTFLAPFPTELAYLSMLFILDVLCTACSAEQIKNK